LLIAWRALHDALIVGFPVVLLAVIACLLWKYWPRRSAPPEPEAGIIGEPAIPPAVAAFVLALGVFGLSTSRADDAALPSPSQISNLKSEISTDRPTIANVSILSASYSGTVNDRVALLEAVLQFSSAKAGQTIPLFCEDAAVQQFTVKSGEAKLVRDGNRIAVRLGKRGDATVQIKLLVKVAGDVTKRHLTFGIPQALVTQVALTLDQPEADVDFPTAISFKRATEKDKTRVEAVIGSADHIELHWTPRVKRAAEVAATVFCQNAALITVGGGVVNIRAVLDFQVTQGELRQARVRLPAGQRLLRVEGQSIRTWELKEQKPLTLSLSPSDGERVAGRPGEGNLTPGSEQILVVELLKGISPSWRLTVETEKVLDALPVSVAVEVPHALEVKRETGLVALRGAEELSLSVESASDLQRVDAEEFARATGVSITPSLSPTGGEGVRRAAEGEIRQGGLLAVFRFLKPEFALRARAEAVRPQIEAVVRNNVRVSAEQISLSATVDYTIKRAGVFALKLALPDGYRLEHVAGTNVQQWTERNEGEARLLEITLKERTSGDYTLHLELARTFKELPKSLAIAGVHPLDTAKLTGFVAVSADSGVAAKTETFDGLTEIPAVSLPDRAAVSSGGSVLAYKFISAEPKSAPEWKLSVATESVEAWVRAEIVNTITLTEALVSGRALVRYDIANAPVKELRVRVPAAFKNVEISGPNIRRRDQTGDVWRVELQSKTRGSYTLTVTWEQPRSASTKTNAVELSGIAAEGVERETGLLAIIARPPLQVTELTAQDLQKVDVGDFPDWAGRPDQTTALAYRYGRPGYKLALDARRFDEADVLQALVDNARFTTVVADDGQMMTEISLSVRNNGRQFLEVELPAAARVWSAFVAGQPVRPSLREGKLLLPIEQSGADGAAMSVELTYVGTNAFPRTRGRVAFASPKFDVPLKNARWELFLPADYDYEKFSGTMTREVVAAAKPSLLNFSLSEYTRMERANKEGVKAEVKRDVSEAEKNLSSGNVRDAVADYKRAKARRLLKDEDADVKMLEQKLNDAQASNLIVAQDEFTRRYGLALNEPQQQRAEKAGKAGVQYDTAAAEQQWQKLQQAQEIVAAKVQPLRVNLPVRGLRYAFTQVLQTEVNKAMTIQLQAANTKTGHWLNRIGLGLVSFLALWAVVAVVAVRKHA
jgi:hypothetical protein